MMFGRSDNKEDKEEFYDNKELIEMILEHLP